MLGVSGAMLALYWQSLQLAQVPTVLSQGHAEHSSIGIGQVAAPTRIEEAPTALLSNLKECLPQAGSSLTAWPKIRPSGPLKGDKLVFSPGKRVSLGVIGKFPFISVGQISETPCSGA